MIVGGTVRGDGQCGLVLVEQDLQQHILVFIILTVEDKLDISSHGEDIEVDPSLDVEFFEILYLTIVAIESQQTGEWQHDGLVTKAQCGTIPLVSDTKVGFLDDLTQQVTLRERLRSTVIRTVSEE